MATKVSRLTKENTYSYGIKVETEKRGTLVVPVIDVRDGQHARNDGNRLWKNSRVSKGSNFMRPSFSVNGNCYQSSQKSNF